MEVEYTGPTIRVLLPDTVHPDDLAAISHLLLSGESPAAPRMLAPAPSAARLRPPPRALPMGVPAQPQYSPAPITVEPEPAISPAIVRTRCRRQRFTLSPKAAKDLVVWGFTGALFVCLGGGLALLNNHGLLRLNFAQGESGSTEPPSQADLDTLSPVEVEPAPDTQNPPPDDQILRVPDAPLPPIGNPQAGNNPPWPLTPPPPALQ